MHSSPAIPGTIRVKLIRIINAWSAMLQLFTCTKIQDNSCLSLLYSTQFFVHCDSKILKSSFFSRENSFFKEKLTIQMHKKYVLLEFLSFFYQVQSL